MTQLVNTFRAPTAIVAPRIQVARPQSGIVAAVPLALLAVIAIAANIVFSAPTSAVPVDGNPLVVMQTIGEVRAAVR